MPLITIGLNHNTAPLELREHFATRMSDVAAMIGPLRQAKISRELALLSTCNRVEIYSVPDEDGDIEI